MEYYTDKEYLKLRWAMDNDEVLHDIHSVDWHMTDCAEGTETNYCLINDFSNMKG